MYPLIISGYIVTHSSYTMMELLVEFLSNYQIKEDPIFPVDDNDI